LLDLASSTCACGVQLQATDAAAFQLALQ
jgi:hypothetical protein